MANTVDRYEKEAVPQLMEFFGYQNRLQAPKIEKIVLNMGLGEGINNPKIVESAAFELTMIAGQKAVITRAKKPIAAFKLRSGMPIGCMVTLRRQKCHDFFEKLVNIALPRVRDFKGISGKAFDGRGNYSLGIKEHIIFPEIDYDRVDSIKGMNVSIITSAKTNEEGKKLLSILGMPFRN